MNPTFSSSKLRELGPILVTCTDRLIDVLKNDAQTEINVSQYFKRFTMDSIWNCAFGVDINMQYEKENEYFSLCEQIFKNTLQMSLPQYMGVYFYEFKVLIFELLILFIKITSKFSKSNNLFPFIWLNKKIGDLVNMRIEKGIKKKDYIQLLIDARVEEGDKNFDYFDIKKALTRKEIEANLALFMLAGYETTSTTLSYVSHVLITYPEEQVKLYDEAMSHFGSDASLISSDSVQELKYLDWFIKEVLRIYPIANS